MYPDTYAEEQIIKFDKNGEDILKVLNINEERGNLIIKLARKQKASLLHLHIYVFMD